MYILFVDYFFDNNYYNYFADNYYHKIDNHFALCIFYIDEAFVDMNNYYLNYFGLVSAFGILLDENNLVGSLEKYFFYLML